MKVAIITGGSSGIGAACVQKFCEKGYRVYEISRHAPTQTQAIHIRGDVTDEQAVKDAFALVYGQEGRLDVLVNNAGFGIAGAVEETELASAKQQFDVNFFGTFLCCREAIGYMRKTGGGRIINISSLAAELAIPFQAFYSASKAAVNALTLALANEVRPFGIQVTAVMPGDVKTGFTAARKKTETAHSLYGERLERSVKNMERDEQNGMSPQSIAEAVFRAAEQPRPKLLVTRGLSYRLIAGIAKILPARAVNTLIGQIYAK